LVVFEGDRLSVIAVAKADEHHAQDFAAWVLIWDL
jgi:hypothetical protein